MDVRHEGHRQAAGHPIAVHVEAEHEVGIADLGRPEAPVECEAVQRVGEARRAPRGGEHPHVVAQLCEALPQGRAGHEGTAALAHRLRRGGDQGDPHSLAISGP